MITAVKRRWAFGISVAAITTALSFGAAVLSATPAAAAVFLGFGFSFPIGVPYYYPPYPYPYYPPPPYYPPLAYYPPPAYSSPPAGYQSSNAYMPPGSAVTYTSRPGWTNAQGQYCREYESSQTTAGRVTERYGTACRDASGQWHFVN
jgi:hypothetical protein